MKILSEKRLEDFLERQRENNKKKKFEMNFWNMNSWRQRQP
jgi:hypothetical protein